MIIQEIREAELEVSLGYLKNEKDEVETDNKRNGHNKIFRAKDFYFNLEDFYIQIISYPKYKNQ